METKKIRFKYVDILRGIGIVFMIMGHVGFGGKFDRYIHSFHMPLFFCVSGYLFKIKNEVSIHKLIINKVQKLLIPYMFFASVNYIFWLLFESDGRNLLDPLIRLVTYNTSKLPIGSAIWFLTAIFWVEVFYLLIDRIFQNMNIKHILIFIISFGGSIFQTLTDFRMPLTIDIAFVCLGFYHIGRVFREREVNIRNNRIVYRMLSDTKRQYITIAVLLIINASITFLTPYVNVKMGWYGFVPVFWINALIGISAYYLLTIKIDQITGRARFISYIFAEIGKDSIVYLGFNQLIIYLTTMLLTSLDMEGISVIGNSVLELIIVISILFIISNILDSNKLRFLIGR